MFKKLFKYDFKSLFNIWRFVIIGVVAINILGAISFGSYLKIMITPSMSELPWIWAVNLVLLGTFTTAIFTLIAVSIYNVVMAIIRYIKNLCSDQAYLTYSFPVKRKYHILSKLLSTYIIEVLTQIITVILICFYILAIGIVMSSSGAETTPMEFNGWFALYIFEFVVMFLISPFAEYSVVFMITQFLAFGNKTKKLLAVVAVIGGYFVLQFGIGILAYSLIFDMFAAIEIFALRPVWQLRLWLSLVFFATILFTCLLGACSYFRLKYRVEERLNLR